MTKTPSSLIDSGFLLKGIPNAQVASRILDRNDRIQGVVFYDDNHDQIIMERRTYGEDVYYTTLPVASSKVALEDRFNYCDHDHLISGDIEQDKYATTILTVGNNTCLESDLIRSISKVRDLKDSQQTINLVYPNSLESSIRIDEEQPIKIEDIVEFSRTNESLQTVRENFIGNINRIKDLGRRAALDKILQASNIYQIQRLFRIFEPFLIYDIEKDLIEKYGKRRQNGLIYLIINEEKEAMLRQLKECGEFSQPEIQSLTQSLEAFESSYSNPTIKASITFTEEDLIFHFPENEKGSLTLSPSQVDELPQENIEPRATTTIRQEGEFQHKQLKWAKETTLSSLANLNRYTADARKVLPFSLFAKEDQCRFFLYEGFFRASFRNTS